MGDLSARPRSFSFDHAFSACLLPWTTKHWFGGCHRLCSVPRCLPQSKQHAPEIFTLKGSLRFCTGQLYSWNWDDLSPLKTLALAVHVSCLVIHHTPMPWCSYRFGIFACDGSPSNSRLRSEKDWLGLQNGNGMDCKQKTLDRNGNKSHGSWNETRGQCPTRLTPTETIFTNLVSGSENIGLLIACFFDSHGRSTKALPKASMSTLGCETRISLGIQRPIGDYEGNLDTVDLWYNWIV